MSVTPVLALNSIKIEGIAWERVANNPAIADRILSKRRSFWQKILIKVLYKGALNNCLLPDRHN